MALSDMLTPKIVELGAVRIGTLGDERKSQGGGTYRMPTKLDHFIITTNFRADDGKLVSDDALIARLKSEYGDPRDGQLREIPIALLSDDIESSLKSAYVHYRGKKCFARSDGVTLWKYFDLKTGAKLDTPEELEWDPELLTKTFNKAPLFKKHTSLEFVIRVGEARWGGVYRFRTTSMITGDQLYGSLLHLKRLTSGVMTGMPLMLVVRPIIVSPDGKPTKVYVVHVELRGNDLAELQTRALESARFQKSHRLELRQLQRELNVLNRDPGDMEDDETQAINQQVFHPEGSDDTVQDGATTGSFEPSTTLPSDSTEQGDDQVIDADPEAVVEELPKEQTPFERFMQQAQLCFKSADAARMAMDVSAAVTAATITQEQADNVMAILRENNE